MKQSEKKNVPFRLHPQKHKNLFLYCVENEITAQKLLENFVDLVLEKNVPIKQLLQYIKEAEIQQTEEIQNLNLKSEA